MIDRFDYCEGTYLFCSEHYSGMRCELYARMNRLTDRFKFEPSLLISWANLEHGAREVYRAWCERENVTNQHDQAATIIQQSDSIDCDDECVTWFIDYIDEESAEECSLVNFDRSDFVNVCMPYTRDLIEFYDESEDSLKKWLDEWLDGCGMSFAEWLNNTSHHTTIKDVDDIKTAVVNHVMTYVGCRLLEILQEHSD
tara:strand:- start:59 stop:652 length:594 start_codon:yes stop_codon:yes gene_type:complete